MNGLSKARGRDKVDGFENTREMEGVLESQRGGYGFDGGISFQQHPRGVFHPQTGQVLIGTLVMKTGEEPSQIRAIDLAGFRDGSELGNSEKIPMACRSFQESPPHHCQ